MSIKRVLMTSLTQELIEKYYKELIQHHKDIFNLHAKAAMNKTNFIAIHEDILSFINILRQIDYQFEDTFLDTILEDVINLVHFINSMSCENEATSAFIENELKKIKEISGNHEEIKSLFIKEFKLNKNILLHLLNTKFFYLDKYIWYKINNSHELRQLLKIKKLSHVNSTIEYLKHNPNKKSFMSLDYKSFKINLHKTYNKEDIEFVKQLALHHEPHENKAIEQLIRYKHKIPYFTDVSEYDIRDVIKEVQFLHCKEHEVLIKELDTTHEIFFLVDGECRVSWNQKSLGTIHPETIFGEFSFITKQPRSATVKTNTECIVISFLFDFEQFDNNPCLYAQLYKNIAEELVKKIYVMNKEHLSI